MCDEAKLERWAKDALSRREFGAFTGLAALAACSPSGGDGEGAEDGAAGTGSSLTESGVSFDTQDGTMDAFLVHPDNGTSHPAVIMWPDIGGIRESTRNPFPERTRAKWRTSQTVSPAFL